MREIEFRAKGLNTNTWYYGSLIKGNNYDFIITEESYENVVATLSTLVCQSVPVKKDDETVGQYTGLKDKNGKKIFEGDIVKINGWWNAAGPAGYNENQTVVEFNDEFCGFTPMCDYDCDCGVYHPADECEVIGNIHDNPELLKQFD